MKIHRVRLQGFGPYRDTEVVDFDAFDDDGIFLITGRTGAGKTSVLDAVTFALFGRVPRYQGAAGEKVRSDHLAPTDLCEVELEFSVPAGRYRVRRSPAHMRPRKRGDGLTQEAPAFELAQRVGDDWQVLEAKVGNAERRVSDIVPLTAEQFQQVVLLAQGQFQEFLVADSKDRQALLSKLFDTSRFTAYADDLTGRAKALRVDVAKGSTRIETQVRSLADLTGQLVPDTVEAATGAGVDEWLLQVRAIVTTDLDLARQAEEQAVKESSAARAALTDARSVVSRQERLAAARARQAALQERAPEVELLRAAVEVGRRAQVAQEACRAVGRARTALAAAQERAAATEERYRETVGTTPGDDLDQRVAQLTQTLGTVREAAAVELSLPGLERALGSAETALEQHVAQVAVSREERETLRAEVEHLRSRVDELTLTLTSLEEAPVALEQALAGHTAAAEHAHQLQVLARARLAQVEATRNHAEASTQRSDLVARRFAEYAGELAQGLVAGESCLVCGSTEHPAPAGLAEGHVDDAALDDAEQALARSAEQVSAANDAVGRCETKVEALATASAGRTVEEWAAEVERCRADVERRTSLRAELTASTRRRDTLSDQVEALTRQVDEAGAREAVLAAAVAAATQALTEARERVEAATEGHATVADRLRALQADLTVSQEHLSAVAALVRAGETVTGAEAVRDDALRDQGLQDEAQVAAALLDADALSAHEQAVRAHDRDVDQVTGALAAPDLQDVPTEPVDLEPLQRHADDTAAVASQATQVCGAAQQRADAVERTAERIEADLASTGELRREYSVLSALADTLRGQGQNDRRIALEAFALAAELEEIVDAANLRLSRMTGGRYEFRHSDERAERGGQSGLALEVLDAHTGEGRSPKSLSGGEKFQASLALALGLAEVVTARSGGLRLDTLFIDEGFGTLDPETLESTMATLDSLREGGRTVGLISHVSALKEAIPAQLFVDVTPGGWSTIRQL